MLKYIGDFDKLKDYEFVPSENAAMLRYNKKIARGIYITIFMEKDHRGKSQYKYAFNHKRNEDKWIIPRIVYINNFADEGESCLEEEWLIQGLIKDGLVIKESE